ncbi:hypothetical protein TELCIR_20132, partial [Teladorsagia circumcincta]
MTSLQSCAVNAVHFRCPEIASSAEMDECTSEISSSNGASGHSPATITEISPRNCPATDDDCTSLQSLYDKYSLQQKEIERLEEQNSEYREKLLKTIRERDLNEELLRNLRDAQKKETSEFEKRIRDYEIQLKAVQERAAAQEAHYSVTMKDLSLKYNTSVSQACNTTSVELKQQNDVLRKQLIQMKEEKGQLQEENRQLSLKTQILESRRMHESEELSRSQQDMERRLTEANAQCAHLSDANREANARLEEVTRENLDLMNKLQDLEDKLSLEEEAHAAASIEISRLQGIENQVL